MGEGRTFTTEERQQLIDFGLWDFAANKACYGWEQSLEQSTTDLRDALAHNEAERINSELTDTRRRLSDEELRVLWRIAHNDFIVYARMVELAHGVE